MFRQQIIQILFPFIWIYMAFHESLASVGAARYALKTTGSPVQAFKQKDSKNKEQQRT